MTQESTPAYPQRHRSWWLRLAFALTAMAQLSMLVFATSASAHEVAGAPAHVDVGGTQKHFVHDEANCVACAVHHLTALGSLPVTPLPPPTTWRAESPNGERVYSSTASISPSAPRAPPASL